MVDDSVVVRKLIQDALSTDHSVEVIGTARNGLEAIQMAKDLRPDVITMDIEMPKMNGIEAVRGIRAAGISTPIIMFSTLTDAGASATLDALSAGASDFVTKPGNVGRISESMESVRSQVIPKIKALTGGRSTTMASAAARPGRPRPTKQAEEQPAAQGAAAGSVQPAATETETPLPTSGGELRDRVPKQGERRLNATPQAVLIGSSTGGPQALQTVLAALPGSLRLPVFVTQHMPPVFTKQLAERLDKLCALTVTEAVDGDLAKPGHVYLAPGDYHLVMTRKDRQIIIHTNQDPPVNFCRPSVDVMFNSALNMVGGGAIAVMLTGMGSDGCKATVELFKKGAPVVTQDEATSVVWGMPGAVAKANAYDDILPISQIANKIVALASGKASAGRGAGARAGVS